MKKSVALLLTLAMAASMVACGAKTQEAPAVEEAVVEESVAEEVVEEVTEEVTEETAEVAVMTYEEYAAAEVDTEVTVETYVQAKQSWWEDKATVYTQDENGAYYYFGLRYYAVTNGSYYFPDEKMNGLFEKGGTFNVDADGKVIIG